MDNPLNSSDNISKFLELALDIEIQVKKTIF